MIDENGSLPMVQGISLSTLMSTYEGVITMLKDACTQLTDDDLARIVTFGHENEKQATVRWGMWHIADHSRYHQAHINQLRRWYQEAY
ncbi:DinB superfamily protein [Paenibacillus sp. RU5A]|nr:DinB superfamily protein [Paenibacillus sp. RU5A]SOC67079.1 DinB superfamily protein [Paenibacillus sp. RU26A]SOC69773.1 DinB superfamily protein [Paenibacillus sp. RU5M]